jgi:metal-responsive CopG/Arc/MetJ family transcriptional regulator
MRETFRADLPQPIAQAVDRMAEERGLSRPALIREALGLLQVVHQGRHDGRYLGFTSVRANLETIVVTPV